MNVLVLSPSLYNTAPGLRFRIEQWARYLHPFGHTFTFASFEDDALHEIIYKPGHLLRKAHLIGTAFARRLRSVLDAHKFDLVFLSREAALLGPAWLERILACLPVPIVYDFDDPVWLRYRSPSNSFLSVLKFPSKTASICRLATRVTVGNRLLAAWATRSGSRHVDIIPSTVDMACYPPPPVKYDSTVTLGWSGSHSTLPFLNNILPILRQLASTRRFRLVVTSHTDSYSVPEFGLETVSRKWRAETEAADLADIDIGLAPFPDTGWTPWRCHGKVLQYMATGIPTVATNIGILPEYIEDGVNGYLVTSESDWIHRLQTLIDNPDLRSRMGAFSRAKVDRSYSAHVWAPKVAAVLEAAVRPSYS